MDLRAHATAVSTQNAYIRAKATEQLKRYTAVYTNDAEVTNDCVDVKPSGNTLVGVIENDVAEGHECAVATSGLVTIVVAEKIYNSSLSINAPIKDDDGKCIGTFVRKVQPILTSNGLEYYVRVMLSPWVNAMPSPNMGDFTETITTIFKAYVDNPPKTWDDCKKDVLGAIEHWLRSIPSSEAERPLAVQAQAVDPHC